MRSSNDPRPDEPSTVPRLLRDVGLSRQEARSVTHGDFWIPYEAREVYKLALRALNAHGRRYVVAGAYAIHEHTGIYRETKDLDVFVEPSELVPAMRTLREAGFTTRLEQPHWLAKATRDGHLVDMIFGMGNGLALVDRDWYRHSSPAILAATPVRVAPAEEMLWHRLFIGERHRQDMADIAHLLVCEGHAMDWRRLLAKTGEHWPLLLAQLQIFHYVYPEYHGAVPTWVLELLLQRAHDDARRERTGARVTRGTLISRFSFAIDVNEWGFRDCRRDAVAAMLKLPAIRDLATSDVWDEWSEDAAAFRRAVDADAH
ncbi:MAG TPA: hypothetical protein VFK13_14915 [Gemmatimonadaceae bacterium]|nr:hypothetical protein [Gemmatimonadaceae bacterium]